jgi:hypothetical protein
MLLKNGDNILMFAGTGRAIDLGEKLLGISAQGGQLRVQIIALAAFFALFNYSPVFYDFASTRFV